MFELLPSFFLFRRAGLWNVLGIRWDQRGIEGQKHAHNLVVASFQLSFLSCSTYWLRMVIFCLSIPYLRMKLLALPLDLAVLPWYVINAILVG